MEKNKNKEKSCFGKGVKGRGRGDAIHDGKRGGGGVLYFVVCVGLVWFGYVV